MLTPCLLALACPSPTPPPDVLVVDDVPGPGVDFVDLPAAIEAAQAGDLVLIRTGTYSPSRIERGGVNLVADSGAFVFVDGRLEVFVTEPDAAPIVVDGLVLGKATPPAGGAPGLGHFAAPLSTSLLWLEDISAPGTFGPSTTSPTRTLFFQSVEALFLIGVEASAPPLPASGNYGGVQGLWVKEPAEQVAIYESTFASVRGSAASTSAVPGAQIEADRLLASASAFIGASGSPASLDPFSQGCLPAGDGGAGVELAISGLGGGLYDFVGGTSVGGLAGGSDAAACPADAVDGPAFGGLVAPSFPVVSNTARTLDVTRVVRPGELGWVTFQGRPNELVFLGLALEADQLDLPNAVGPLALGASTTVLPLGSADATGALAFEFTSPLPPGLGLQLFLQAASTGSGDGTVLSTPRTTVLLGNGF